MCGLLAEPMAGTSVIVHPINLLELGNALEGFFTEGMLTLEGMKCYAFKQVAERDVKVFSQSFENLDQALFHACPNLYPLNRDGLVRQTAIFLSQTHNTHPFKELLT